MKLITRLLAGLAIVSGAAWAASTFTTHYNLEKPADGDENWGNGYRSNLNTIDTQMFTTATGLSDHIADTSGAHAASAISSTVGSACNTSTNVQSYLACLDAQVDALTGGGGGVVTIENSQTITGEKTFSTTPIFSALSSGVLKSDGSGNISSSSVTNAETTATDANTASAIVARDSSGNFSAGTITAALSGNASTATALAANPTDCGAGTKATAIDASGNLTCSAVSLTADVSGVMPLANGGTNKNMTAVNGGVVWTDADSQEVTVAGTSGQFLKSNGAAAPSWQSARTFWRVNANIATTNTSDVSLGTGSQSTYATIENANLQLTNNSVNSDPSMLTAQIVCAGTTAPSGTTCTAVNEVIGVAFTIPTGGEGSTRACFSFAHRFAGGTTMDSSVAFAIYETGTADQTAGQGGYVRLSSRSTVDNDSVTGQYVVCDDFYFSTSGQKAIRLFYEQASSNSGGSFIFADAASTVGQRDINVQVYPVGVGF